MINKKSQDLYQEAVKVIVGGVNSPSRSFKKVGLDFPIFMKRAAGAYFWDEDDNRYIDYLAAFGPVILGHAHPRITAAISKATADGILYGTPTKHEVRLASMIKEAIPSMERIRFVNSGTEAVMTTVRLARSYTGRNKILKFAGCYHGHFDLALIEAGSGPATLGLKNSSGIPEYVISDVITIPYNDKAALEQAFDEYGSEIAAALIEPIVGNFGIVLPEPGFLETLQDFAQRAGSLVIYDEVITAFRFRYGGVQDMYDVKPDLTVVGKIIGGGLPIGGYGGRDDIMNHIAPEGDVYQAGTMAGNPLTMSAGIACLEELAQPDFYAQLETKCDALAEATKLAAAAHGHDVQVNKLGGAFSLHFTKEAVTDYSSAEKADEHKFARFFNLLLKQGIYIAPSKYEAWFVTSAHTDADIEKTITAINEAFKLL